MKRNYPAVRVLAFAAIQAARHRLRRRIERAPSAAADTYWTIREDDDGIQPADPRLDWLCRFRSDDCPHREEPAP